MRNRNVEKRDLSRTPKLQNKDDSAQDFLAITEDMRLGPGDCINL